MPPASTLPPSWPSCGADTLLIALRGWAGQLFAVTLSPDGARLLVHGQGEVLHAPDLLTLLASLDDARRERVGISLESLRARASVLEAAHHAEQNDLSGALALLRRAREHLDAPTAAEVVPHPPSPGLWLGQSCKHIARLLLEGQLEMVGCLLDEALALQPSTSPLDGFFWPSSTPEIMAAIAAAHSLEPAPPLYRLPADEADWQVIRLPFTVAHSAGVATDAIPILPRTRVARAGRVESAYHRIANRNVRMQRLIDLHAPEVLLQRERADLTDALATLIGMFAAPEKPPMVRHSAVRSDVGPTRISPPPTGPRVGLFQVPFRFEPARFLLQTPDALMVVDRDGLQHTLPPCPWRPLYGSSDYVAFTGAVRSGGASLECAVLNVQTGSWCSLWPDEPGVTSLHRCLLPETDDAGGWWLIDPRTGQSIVLSGEPLGWDVEGATHVLADAPALGPVAFSPGHAPKLLPLQDSPPPFHIDAVTGTVTAHDPWGDHPLEHWTPQPRPLHGIAISSYGGVIVARNGSVYVNGERLLVIEGPVLDLSLIGGNSTLNGHLALLTPDAILSFTFCAASEDDEGYVVLNERIPITQWTHGPLSVSP